MLDWASGAKVAVIPFGCGSSVVGGVEPAVGDGYAGAVSLDMRRLNRVLEVDETSRAARIQAGIRGPAIEAALKPHGLAIRHYPQSFEFSTLGRLDRDPLGRPFRHALHPHRRFRRKPAHDHACGRMESRRLPGSGAGPSPDRMMIGSEGALGVITEAWMRLQGRPRFRGDAVFGFPDFFAAARGRARGRAGGALSLEPARHRQRRGRRLRRQRLRGEPARPRLRSPPTIPSRRGWRGRSSCIQDHGGRRHADEARGLALAHGVHPHALCARADRAAGRDQRHLRERGDLGPVRGLSRAPCARRPTRRSKEATGPPGTVSTRFTHVYPDGPAAYYTFNVRGDAGRLLEQWRHIKTRASDALIAAGGTITHHHAVGRDHMPWYREQRPALFGKALAAAKCALDPAGIMNPGVLAP